MSHKDRVQSMFKSMYLRGDDESIQEKSISTVNTYGDYQKQTKSKFYKHAAENHIYQSDVFVN